jgi:PAS domain S-box-containing protein
MADIEKSRAALVRENKELRASLAEAEEVLRALQGNEVDAVIVNSPDGEKIYTIQGADHPYRVLVETMNEGAATLITNTGHDVFYCNYRFAAMLRAPLEQVIGASITQFIVPDDLVAFEECLAQVSSGDRRCEMTLRAADGSRVPVLLSFSSLRQEGAEGVCLVATDLTEQKEIVAAEKLARSILEQAAEAIIVCDAHGRVIRASRQAQELCGAVLLKDKFEQSLRLRLVKENPPHGDCQSDNGEFFSLDKVLGGADCRGVEVSLTRPDGQFCYLLVNAGPLVGDDQRIVGCVVTLTDITERKRASAEREQLLARERTAREAAEAANRSKDEWLAVVSHELRSPLNAILGYSRMLHRGAVDAHQVKHCAEVIERGAKTQLQLIEDLLDTARIISGKLRLDIQPVNLALVIERALEVVRPAAEAKQISLSCTLDHEAGQITGDPERLQQVIWNLLSNSVKYTAQGGQVEVRLARVASHIEVIVCDTGKGISADFLPHIFDRFSQNDSSSARRHGGLGLGLALVRHLTELHGGTIEAASEGEGCGATFTVQLPVRAVYTPTDDDEKREFAVEGISEALPLAGIKALVVDDEPEARELLFYALGQYGASVTTASSAAEALEILKQANGAPPDILISDISMPEQDGYNLIQEVRAWERSAGRDRLLPAIALTAFSRTEDRLRALMYGFHMHVAKPVDPMELALVIRTLTGRSGNGQLAKFGTYAD